MPKPKSADVGASAQKSASIHTLYLVDISSFIFRAFFAIRYLSNSKGMPTNAIYGVATMLSKLIQEAQPKNLCIVYDSKEPSFRKEIYTAYKANRSAPPDDLVPQFDQIENLISLFEMHSFRQSGVEADDLIATVTKRWCSLHPQNEVVIVTGDKDLMQLVDPRVCVWDTMKDKVFGAAEVEEKFGLPPSKIRDYLALVGDSSDNVPGIPSIGPKSAVQLLGEFKDLKGVLKAAEQGKIKGKKGTVIQENHEQAYLSQELVSLKEDLDILWEPEQLKYEFKISEELLRFLKELEFHTLVEKWSNGSNAEVVASKKEEKSDQFICISTKKDFEKLLARIEKEKEFIFDLETTSLDVFAAEIVGWAFAFDEKQGFYVPVGHRIQKDQQLDAKFVLDSLKPYLENPRYKKIGQNLKYDWSVLYQQGVEMDGLGGDTMIASYVIEPAGRHNMDVLATKYLDYQTLKFEEVCGKGKDQISFDQVDLKLATRYAAEDAWVTSRLWHHLLPRLQEENLMEVFSQVEMPLVTVLAKMEMAGVSLAIPWLKKLSTQFGKRLIEIEERIQAHAKGPINLNSPKQLGKLLFEDLKLPVQGKTKTGFSTDARVLKALAPLHEVPRELLEYREISKLKSTYVDPLPKLVNPKTHKIHGSFHQTVAATGRLSSSDPNLQNIPTRTARGQMIRKAFIPSEGNVLLSADYSQIELRLLADMSEDPSLIASFESDEDVHRKTASEIYEVKPEEVTDEQRGVAKAINFGLMYGKTAFGLSQELGISRSEAKEMIDRYFTRYKKVKAFLDAKIKEARDQGWVMTKLGRKRHLPEIHSKNHAVRANAERMAMNTPVQGTAADLIKLAMIRLDQAIIENGFKAKLIIQVHDELVLDVPQKEVEKVAQVLVEVMEGAMKLKVPLRVNTETGADWSQL